VPLRELGVPESGQFPTGRLMIHVDYVRVADQPDSVESVRSENQ
jgi:hypothetical protein